MICRTEIFKLHIQLGCDKDVEQNEVKIFKQKIKQEEYGIGK